MIRSLVVHHFVAVVVPMEMENYKIRYLDQVLRPVEYAAAAAADGVDNWVVASGTVAQSQPEQSFDLQHPTMQF